MGDKSAIEWTDATWNPVTGCSKVSPGCAHCYAERLALTRLRGKPGYPGLPWTPANAEANVTMREDRLGMPLRWTRPRRIFVNSLSDLFHERLTVDFVAAVFAVMAIAERHTFQVLTKRPGTMAVLLNSGDFWIRMNAAMLRRGHRVRPGGSLWDHPLPNVWLGTSVENQRWAEERIPALLATPASVRFLSMEPLLGDVSLSGWIDGLDWVIAGGESGPSARPMDAEWVRHVRNQCKAAGVPFLFKQWGGIRPKAGGRELDGRTWDQYPEAR